MYISNINRYFGIGDYNGLGYAPANQVCMPIEYEDEPKERDRYYYAEKYRNFYRDVAMGLLNFKDEPRLPEKEANATIDCALGEWRKYEERMNNLMYSRKPLKRKSA